MLGCDHRLAAHHLRIKGCHNWSDTSFRKRTTEIRHSDEDLEYPVFSFPEPIQSSKQETSPQHRTVFNRSIFLHFCVACTEFEARPKNKACFDSIKNLMVVLTVGPEPC